MIKSLKFLTVILLSVMVAACGSEEKDITDRMAEEHEGDVPVQNESVLYEQQRPVDTMQVNYAETDSGAISGFLAKPQNASENLPGIIVIHEWWGLNDNVRMMTKRLAGLGYTALAVDLYNGQVASSPEFAKKYMQQAQSNPEGTIANLNQAYTYLNEQQNAENIGVIGWCFGGGWSLQTALEMPDKIDAAVIYYGQLVTDLDRLQTLNMPVIGFFGGQDQGIPTEQVNTFKDNLEMLEKDAEIYIYEDAGHAFANPSGTRYNKQAAQDAWEKTKAFLNENLKD
ncbi:MAG: dienelactone hydrolase family protein [Balneolaceae bacterium]|nr:dienelactone hydrolase family protein [Balneolaceae bacterium]